MHRALLIFEILLEIFKHVNATQDPIALFLPKISAPTYLAALARTCKTFYEPAMNELWAEIYGLNPLLGCVTRLYPIIYRAKRPSYKHPDFDDIEPLSANEARQFLRHAARVRSIHLEVAFNHHFRLLSVLPEKTCMFPRLQSLFTASLPCPTRYLHLFLSPTLRRCVLCAIVSDLKLIVTRCTALEHLYLMSSGPTSSDTMSILSDSVRVCKRLVTLYFPPLDWAAWEHLSNLPTLFTVTVDMRSMVTSPSNLDNISLGPFLNLTALSFRAQTAAYITSLMQHSEFPSLKDIVISFCQFPWADAERFFYAISQFKACQTLEKIRITSWCSGGQDPDNSWTAITHLRRCPQLRVLNLQCPYCCAHLDNNSLLEAMSCWPHIRSLELNDTKCRQATITFRGLFAALRQCPHLDTLRMLIDAMNIDVDPTTEPSSSRHTSLQLLDVRSAKVVDTEAVARIIFSMLPCVDKVYHAPDSSHANAWHEVRNYLKDLKSSAVVESP
ncbi:uncharacterized protein EDB93DRAFT_754580 [Suillus bovinus]|uniref:uncharacterized protein n=1 Tax=Suillus bovinus TaxID=48563 RepID=UPI001B86A0B7|nr:uncharacterized protein EDB93DRAFT_754580 [Suillus bovinus]KAG2137871.1 hypothetical protein EDB93DRAFT_754580 [Suillus bovinus]